MAKSDAHGGALVWALVNKDGSVPLAPIGGGFGVLSVFARKADAQAIKDKGQRVARVLVQEVSDD